MSDEDLRDEGAAAPEPPATAPDSLVPRTTESGLHASLDALRPTVQPQRGADAPPAPPPSPRRPPAPEADTRALDDRRAHESDSAPLPISQELPAWREPPADPGAHAAYRAIGRRTGPELRRPGLAIGAPDVRARAALLEHLAQRGAGPARARLLTASAECWQRAGEPAHARALYEQAYVEDASDPVLLRELRKYAIAERDAARAAQLLEREAELPIAAEERALAWSLLAEIELVLRRDRAAAERAAARAFAAHPSLGSALQVYTLHIAAGRDRDAAEALRGAAARWSDTRARSALLLLAARLLFRGGEPVAAQVLFELSHDADPQALDALLGWARAAREGSDVGGAAAALTRLESSLAGSELAEHALRARARLLDTAGDAPQALRLLAKVQTVPGLRLRARLAELTAERSERRAALERWAEVAGGSERALALLGLAELQLAEKQVEAAASSLEQAIAADGSSALARTMQAALARSTGSAALGNRSTGRDDEARLEAAARLAIDPAGTVQERALLAELEVKSPTAAALALDAAAELADWRAVHDALAHEARQLAGAQRSALELIGNELRGRFAAEPAAAGDDAAPARAPSTALGWLQQTYAAPDRAAAGIAWLELSALADGELAAFAATLAGDCLADSGRAREAYERALAAEPGHAPACWSLEPILLARDDAPALQRLHAALARSTRDPIERAARLLRAVTLAGSSPGDDRREAFHELAAGSTIDALLCDRELHVAGEGAQLALADALEGAGHGAAGALADLAALRAAAGYESCGEPARAAVLYRAIRDRKGEAGAHAEVGLERTLAAAGLSGLLTEQLDRARRDSEAPAARRAAAERLALQQAASGDERRAAPVFRELSELDPDNATARRALQRHAMREGDHELLAASAAALARRTRDARERAAQLRLVARADALRGRAPAIDAEPEAELELWQAVERERAARGRGDAQAIAQAALRLCVHLRVANERASYAMRAAEALELVSPAQAIAALEPHAFAAPNHPLAFEMLARLRHAAGDVAQAAADYEHAAGAAPVPARSARLWYRAAVLWQDAVPDAKRARLALERVVEIDPLYRDAFPRLKRLLAAYDHARELATLYETRLAAGGEPGALADLHVEHARVLARAGDESGARAALAAALALDAHRSDALRAAADLDVAAGRFADAAETLIQLARVTRDPQLLRACFLELGRMYTEHVPDPRRAEIAYARAVSLDPQDARAIEQLMRVLRDKRDYERAVRACERLIELARDDAELDRRTVELASILEDQGEARRAERSLNARRERRPAAAAILTALADLYARQHDQAALVVHLDRSVHALRAALVDHPEDASAWTALCEMLRRRGRIEAAACAARLARDLGVADGQIEKLAAGTLGLGGAALEGDALGRLWAQGEADPAVELLRWLDAVADELLPAGALHRNDQPPAVLQSAVAGARTGLGLPDIALFALPGCECVPLRARPLAIAVGERLTTTCDRDELAFALMRAAAVARLGLGVAVRSDPRDLGALIDAARSQDLPRDEAPDEEPLAAQMRERIEQRLTPKRRAELQSLARRTPADGFALQALALEIGARVAFVATGAIAPALCAIAACDGEEPITGYEQHDPLLALEDDGARALLRFALSESYMELPARVRDSARPGAHG